MAQKRVSLSCSMCVNLLKDPVTIPCGHSYCMDCITSHWDAEGKKKSCPQCRTRFTPRPVLEKSVVLAVLVDLRRTSAPAGPEDAACDVSTGRKLKATKSCLVSCCEEHLYDVTSPVKHGLEQPSTGLQEDTCSLRSAEGHKGHDAVTSAAEGPGRGRNVRRRLLGSPRDAELLRREAIDRSANEAVEESRRIFSQLMCLLDETGRDVEQWVRSQQRTGASRVEALREEQEQDKKKEQEQEKKKEQEQEKKKEQEKKNEQEQEKKNELELEEQERTDARMARGPLPFSRPVGHFGGVAAAVQELGDQLRDVLRKGRANVSLAVAEVDVSPAQPEPRTRAELLRYSRDVTLDPDTAHALLLLSDGDRRATRMSCDQVQYHHPDRFSDWWQVLSREGLTGRCYWEVGWTGGECGVAVAYESISRAGASAGSRFGGNVNSWMLDCNTYKYQFHHNGTVTPVSGPRCSRVGVYLDHRAGLLSFYSISGTTTLLHRVQTTFSRPLHAGLWLFYHLSTAQLCKP